MNEEVNEEAEQRLMDENRKLFLKYPEHPIVCETHGTSEFYVNLTHLGKTTIENGWDFTNECVLTFCREKAAP